MGTQVEGGGRIIGQGGGERVGGKGTVGIAVAEDEGSRARGVGCGKGHCRSGA